MRGCKPRIPLSVGKDRLIFTFHARALSDDRGYFPVCDQAIANYRGGRHSQTTVGEFPVRGARL